MLAKLAQENMPRSFIEGYKKITIILSYCLLRFRIGNNSSGTVLLIYNLHMCHVTFYLKRKILLCLPFPLIEVSGPNFLIDEVLKQNKKF